MIFTQGERAGERFIYSVIHGSVFISRNLLGTVATKLKDKI